jgi:hypothetical protein
MGELLSAQPRWMPAALQAWEHAGLRCAIIASPLGGWNGYVQLPGGHPWRRRAGPIGDLTYGPSAEGWVGFDTGHAGDAWHPDDDHPPYEPPWWRRLRGAPPFPPPALDLALTEHVRRLRLQLAQSLGQELWTLPKLRAAVEDLAAHLATVPPPPPAPVVDLQDDWA